MDNTSSQPIVSLSSLRCRETETCLDDELDENPFLNLTDHAISASDSEDEYIQLLLERETSSGNFRNREASMLENLNKNARLDAIHYILNSKSLFGFQFQTAYLSVFYFDRFLSKRSIGGEKSWAVQLLSMACLSLAAKLEECCIPSLSEFQLGEYNFESKIIQRMELLVLNTLEWEMASVTPFAYLPHFINKFCYESPRRGTISRTVENILAIMREVNLMDHHPSAIASAAILVALDQRLTRKEVEFIDIEDVFTCYNIIQQLELDKIRMPKLLFSPHFLPTNLRKIDVFQSPSATPPTSRKRKRLKFNEIDQNYGSSDKKSHQ
ncbi:hypothetical protein Nepgr_018300 [Nepenthes gracilis]|uniref:Cyclin-like domain-containing protein n=1 Tax=Nepenthes gracilis TaxID=150966 RepID=A0AAD3STA7_NEPGR|nr:hypothetical protein Nepgr_018300 [Nepenthes gracilis]